MWKTWQKNWLLNWYYTEYRDKTLNYPLKKYFIGKTGPKTLCQIGVQ